MSHDRDLARIRAMITERRPDLDGNGVCAAAGTPLADLGLDSLTVVEILLAISADAEVDLEAAFEGMDAPRTVGDLADILHRFEEEP